MYLTKAAIILVMLGLVSSLPQPDPGTNVKINSNVNKNGIRDDNHGIDSKRLNNILRNETSRTVPCQESGGQIQTLECCPWYSSNPDLCKAYDECVCKEGFEGDECEHDCGSNICPFVYHPVCGSTRSADDDITFNNTCQLLTSKCNNEYDGLYFLYDGACQNNIICRRIYCPADVDVVYYDDPDNLGCKLCKADPNAIC